MEVEAKAKIFYCFHILAPCFMKNDSASGSSRSQMLRSLLPLPASFFKVLPLSQKFNCLRILGLRLSNFQYQKVYYATEIEY